MRFTAHICDSIHLYTMSNCRTAVLSNWIQGFWETAGPGERKITQKPAPTWKMKEKISGEIFCLLTFVTISTYSAFCCILSGNKL